MQREYITNQNGRIAYWHNEIRQSRETLFFLHGLTADHTMFTAQIRFFEKHYNIITWDAPAHGQSRPYKSFTYGDAAENMLKILDKYGISKAVLIGQSMGGFISQSFIARYPDRVKGFVSIDSTPYGDYYSQSDMWLLKHIEPLAALYPERLLKVSMSIQVSVTRRGQRNMSQMLSVYSKKELCHLMGIGYTGFIEENRPIEIPCPVILIMGEKDITGKVQAYNREWTKRTGYPLIRIRNAAHNSNVDAPKAVNRIIMCFLRKLR